MEYKEYYWTNATERTSAYEEIKNLLIKGGIQITNDCIMINDIEYYFTTTTLTSGYYYIFYNYEDKKIKDFIFLVSEQNKNFLNQSPTDSNSLCIILEKNKDEEYTVFTNNTPGHATTGSRPLSYEINQLGHVNKNGMKEVLSSISENPCLQNLIGHTMDTPFKRFYVSPFYTSIPGAKYIDPKSGKQFLSMGWGIFHLEEES